MFNPKLACGPRGRCPEGDNLSFVYVHVLMCIMWHGLQGSVSLVVSHSFTCVHYVRLIVCRLVDTELDILSNYISPASFVTFLGPMYQTAINLEGVSSTLTPIPHDESVVQLQLGTTHDDERENTRYSYNV